MPVLFSLSRKPKTKKPALAGVHKHACLFSPCKRYQRMSKKGKHYNLIITAIAREMAAYIWAIAKEVVLTPVNPKLRLSRVPA